MKFQTSTALMVMVGVASARPDALRYERAVPARLPPSVGRLTRFRREVPQEHSHQPFLTGVTTALNLNNVDQVVDPVFSLLGNAAAANGAGKVTNLDCLQQRVADQAFTNAKAANDIVGMTNALMFRALERNTAKVGQASVICNETAVNPEIAAIQQHQDPASSGAAAINKQITLDLAVQLASIGADPQLALQSGTFAPGNVNDSTGKGNSCDDITTNGCIVDQNLLVEDATAAEIDAAVSAAGGSSSGNSTSSSSASSGSASSASSGSASSASSGSASSASSGNSNNNANTANTAATGTVDINKFTGSVGSAPVPIESSDSSRPFSVNGATFQNIGAAAQRACDVQKNACANAANSGQGGSVAACETQQQQCVAANAAKRRRAAADTGSCGSPAIEFAVGLDGRTEGSFAPVNTADFNHGSALKPAVVTSFICQQLSSKCKASAATVTACNNGATAANSLSGQAAADAFNAALGV